MYKNKKFTFEIEAEENEKEKRFWRRIKKRFCSTWRRCSFVGNWKWIVQCGKLAFLFSSVAVTKQIHYLVRLESAIRRRADFTFLLKFNLIYLWIIGLIVYWRLLILVNYLKFVWVVVNIFEWIIYSTS